MTPGTPRGAPAAPGIPFASTLGRVVTAESPIKIQPESHVTDLTRGHSQLRLQLLVHDVADADGGDDFEEVGRQASVEPRRALRLQDVSEESAHFHLLLTFCGSCQDKDRPLSLKRQHRHAANSFLGREGRTLRLHAGADQSQRVTGELPACARHRSTGEQDEHAGVNAIGAVVVQVVVFQRLSGINQVNTHSSL